MQERLPQIFAFASNEWHTPWWMARQHLYTRLARRGWPVVYSTGPQSLWERHSDKWRRGGLLDTFDRTQTGGAEAVLVDRPGKGLPLWRQEGAWNALVTARHARHLSRGGAADGRRRLAHLWHPRFWPYVKLLDADYVVFHIHDAWEAKAWPDHLKRYHNELVERADLIVATADNMSRKLPGIGPGGARILPHGVDFEEVSAGAAAPCPADLAAIPHPRIGYTGRLNMKIDLAGVAEVAERRPDWHWVFIGAVGIGYSGSFEASAEAQAGWERMQRCPNIHLLGVKPRDQIPAYLHHMDVLSIYYRFDDSGYWAAGYPTKLHEYLAAGKPVVSSDLENVRPFANVVRIASTPESWVAAIGEALADGGQGTPEARRAVARAGDWDSRTTQLESWFRELLLPRSTQAAD